MKAIASRLLFTLLSFASFYASAQTTIGDPSEPIGGWFGTNGGDRGRYTCAFTSPPCEDQNLGETPGPQNQLMITSVINAQLNVATWKKGDVVTICNSGGNCTTFQYDGFGNWFSQGYSPDDGNRYSDKVGRRVADSTEMYGSGSTCGVNYVVSSHYEWYDYYSDYDGSYMGSSDLTTVFDGLVPLTMNCV